MIDVHTHLHLEKLAQAIRRWFNEHSDWNLNHPGLPLFTVHLDDAEWLDDAKKAIDDGCIGLKIHEDVQSLQIDDRRFEKVYEQIEKINGFVLAHIGPIPWRLEPEVAVQRVRRVLKASRVEPCVGTYGQSRHASLYGPARRKEWSISRYDNGVF